MAKGKSNIASTVREAITPTVESLGYGIWDVEYVKDGAFWYLRITIDSPEGIDIDDCEKVHRAIDPVIDAVDPIEDQYYLEVSSPGLERDLRTPEHFEQFLGHVVVLKLFTAIDGSKQYTGTLLAYEDDAIVLDLAGVTKQFDKKVVSRAHLFYDFDADMDEK